METKRKVRINRVEGYRTGEIVDLPMNRALTYCRNGQADPVGWEEEMKQPMNRMLDTRQTGSAVSRKKGTQKKKASKAKKPKPSDSGE